MRSLFILSALLPFASALWPIPVNYTSGSTVLWIAPDVQINYSASNFTASNSVRTNSVTRRNYVRRDNGTTSAGPLVQNAVRRALNTIFTESYVPWKFHPRNSAFEPAPTAPKTYINCINIHTNASDPVGATKPLAGAVDESYTLSMTETGQVFISAVSSIGVLRALDTFTQLFYLHSQPGQGPYTPLAPVQIADSPKFAHRGLNMDVSRNYYAPSDIKRTIDAMAASKFNVLHLHVTDAQSWPLDIPALPELAAHGAYGPSLYYTAADLDDIQSYATARGIQPILEIDMPGHTASIAFSHPELIAAFNVQPDWGTYCNEPPSGQFKLNSPDVYSFLSTLFADLLPRLAPHSAYFHTGGDELNQNVYALDPTILSNDSSIIQPFLQSFVDTAHAHVRSQGLVPIVWEEMLLDWNLTLGADVLVQTWLSDASVASTVAAGHKALAGNYNFWYLDCGLGGWIDHSTPAGSQAAFPYLDYCAPTHNWRDVYAYDPLGSVPANLTHLVLGGEIHIWSEQTDPVNLDTMVWPRAAAAAEVLWSGAKDPATGLNRSQVLASPRLADLRERLVAAGVRAGDVQMPFCTQNGTQCASA
ncbi:MAG: hypothetical protein M1819_002433 [Sarea resinae]|nr:MAG: hypothetical protein M1819_002433 [Sarea resinae]